MINYNKKQQQSTVTKNSIINNAMSLFVERGYFNVTLRDIAKRAGLSTGALYTHFKTKEDIAKELFQTTSNFIKEKLEFSIKNANTTKDKIKGIIDTIFILAETNRGMMEYAFYTKHRDIFSDGKSICSSAPLDLLKQFLKFEVKNKRLRVIDINLGVISLTGIAIRLIISSWDGVIKGDVANYKDEVFEIVWGILKPEGSD